MSFVGKIVLKILNSKSTPDFIYARYFKYKIAREREQLSRILKNKLGMINHLKEDLQVYWNERINNVLEGPDNRDIPRNIDAGKLSEQWLTMHNGVKVDPISYYDLPLLKMLIDNKGVHEPQEEKVFQEVLKSLDAKGEKTMLELGAYWAFYSLWFRKIFPDSNCIMVEPNRKNLFFGKRNFKLNNQHGHFIYAGIGAVKSGSKNITTVDAICKERKIKFLDILHCDIQGFELEMLEGARNLLDNKNVGYIFISTHSNELHRDCKHFLTSEYDFIEVANANLDESYSWDGVLVMKAPDYPGIEKVNIAKRKKLMA